MNTAAEHILQAEHNETVLRVLRRSQRMTTDWQVTLLFYIALHYVDAYLHTLRPPTGIHPKGHRERGRQAGEHLGLSLAADYYELQRRSEDARYNGRRASLPDVASLRANEFARIRTHVRAALSLTE